MKLKSKDEIVIKLVRELEKHSKFEIEDESGIRMLKWVLSIEESDKEIKEEE